MFFRQEESLERITEWIKGQLSAVHPVAKNGIDITIKPHKSWRSNEQNRFLMVIMQQIIIFYHETGFMPAGCQKWMMRVDIQ